MSSRLMLAAGVGLIAIAIGIGVLQTRRSRPETVACPADAKKANLNFVLKDTFGKDVNLADYRGKVVLVDFWATWCGPCKVEIPAFIDLYAKYKANGFEAVGVVVLDEWPNVKPFVEKFGMTYPVVNGIDRADLESAFGQMAGLPTSFLISRDGRLCYRHEGLPLAPSITDAFAAEIKSLL